MKAHWLFSPHGNCWLVKQWEILLMVLFSVLLVYVVKGAFCIYNKQIYDCMFKEIERDFHLTVCVLKSDLKSLPETTVLSGIFL